MTCSSEPLPSEEKLAGCLRQLIPRLYSKEKMPPAILLKGLLSNGLPSIFKLLSPDLRRAKLGVSDVIEWEKRRAAYCQTQHIRRPGPSPERRHISRSRVVRPSALTATKSQLPFPWRPPAPAARRRRRGGELAPISACPGHPREDGITSHPVSSYDCSHTRRGRRPDINPSRSNRCRSQPLQGRNQRLGWGAIHAEPQGIGL